MGVEGKPEPITHPAFYQGQEGRERICPNKVRKGGRLLLQGLKRIEKPKGAAKKEIHKNIPHRGQVSGQRGKKKRGSSTGSNRLKPKERES